jgi:hypothetical protein
VAGGDDTTRPRLGCQMVYFQTKNPNIFYGPLGYFMTIWYILCSFFPVLVSFTLKNLATLTTSPSFHNATCPRKLRGTVSLIPGKNKKTQFCFGGNRNIF